MPKSYRAVSTVALILAAIGVVFGIAAIGHHRQLLQSTKLAPEPSNGLAQAPSSGLVPAPEAYPVAPDFSLVNLNGQPIQLSSFHGKVVILDYWATWCAPCKIEIPHLIELQKKYEGQGLQVIGISMDDGPEPVKVFAHELGMNYPIAMGDVKVAEAYGGVLGLPVAFLIDRQGRINRKLVGDAEMQSLEPDVRKLLQQP